MSTSHRTTSSFLTAAFSAVLMLAFSLEANAEDPKLNGVSIHKELGIEQFIAGVYSQTPTSNARQLILVQERKAMEVRILQERLYTGRFKRMWIEGMAINAGKLELERHAQDMVDFSNLLKIKLKRGDILRIERTIGEGVIVSLNGFRLGVIDNLRFFDLIVRTWVGPVPLSTEFKQEILANGNITVRLKQRFLSTTPTPERLVALSNALNLNRTEPMGMEPAPERWAGSSSRESNSQEQADSEANTTNTPQSRPAIVATTPVVTQPQEQENDNQSDANVDSESNQTEQSVATEPKQDLATADVETPQPAPEPAPKKETKTSVPSPPPAKTPAVKSPAPASVVNNDDIFEDEEEEEQLTADKLLSQQLYISKLTKWTASRVKYPRQALKNDQEGTVRVSVTLHRDGKVKNVVFVEKSEYDRLNRAAESAVKKASPYPAVPDEVKGESFRFTVPISFRLH